MLKYWYWKIAAVAMTLYVIFMGLCVPAKPTLYAITPEQALAGDTILLKVEGYNTSFSQQKNGRAWLRLKGKAFAIAAQKIEILDDRHAAFLFQIPKFLPLTDKIGEFSVIFDEEKEGTVYGIRRLMVTQDSVDEAAGIAAFSQRVSDLHPSTARFRFPLQPINLETNRNLFFHVPMWFAMLFLLSISCFYSVMYLRKLNKNLIETNVVDAHSLDLKADAFARVGTLFGTLGFVTGMLWANYTWGSPLTMDIKLISAGVSILIYFAYFIFRNSFEDREKAARFSAVYNIFAFVSLPTLIFVLPRLTASLHPGNGGNPALSSEDTDNTLKFVFYPACIGWILMGIWIAQLVLRSEMLKERFFAKTIIWQDAIAEK